jgi:hypothetical protein
MRKGAGLLAALSLLIPAGILVAGPVGAANTVLPKCKSLSGTQTYKPGLPPTSSNATVKPTTTTVANITGCTGGGITSGKSSGTLKAKTATNCKMLFANAGKPAPATPATIRWSNGQTSTTSNVLTVTGVNKSGQLTAKLVSKYVAGLGKGHTSTIQLVATPNKGWCSTTTLNKVTFKSTSITTK